MDQGKNSAEGTLDKMFVVVYFGIQSSNPIPKNAWMMGKLRERR